MAGRRPAGVAGGQLLRRIGEELASGWPAGLTVLNGDDIYRLDRAQRMLIDSLSPEGPDGFGISVFGEEKVELSTVLAAVRSRGMFASRRVVLVREIGALQGEADGLIDYAAAPPPDSFLIVRAPVLDKRRKLHKALASKGRTLRFEAPRPDDLRRLIADVKELAGEAELRLEADACAFLAEACGGDLYRVESELGKLALWRSGNRPIGLETVREIAAGSGLLSSWAAADALLVRDPAAALGAVRRLVAAGEEPLRILGGLAFRARSMLAARASLDAGIPFHEVVKAARAWAYQDKLKQGLARYSIEDLLRFPLLLLEADRSLKSRAIEPGAVLEALVTRMVGQAATRGG